jgi:alkaline phosphatase D
MDLEGAFLNPDQWDGYPLARQRLLDAVLRHAPGEVVVMTGDVHASGVGYVPEQPLDLQSAPALTEFIVPAISSVVRDARAISLGPLLAGLPQLAWWDFVQKGWVALEITPEEIRADYRHVDDVRQSTSSVARARRWQVTHGVPGAVEVLDE